MIPAQRPTPGSVKVFCAPVYVNDGHGNDGHGNDSQVNDSQVNVGHVKRRVPPRNRTQATLIATRGQLEPNPIGPPLGHRPDMQITRRIRHLNALFLEPLMHPGQQIMPCR
jgi:hypothetical protein